MGHVHPIGRGQKAVLLPGADQVAVDQVELFSHRHRLRAEVLAVQQPLALKGGDQGGELRLEEVVRVAGEVKKAFVAPDDVVRIRPENGDGHGAGEHGPAGGVVHPAGQMVQVIHRLLLPADGAGLEVEIQDQEDHQLRHAEPNVIQAGENGKDQPSDEKQAKARVRQPGKRFLKGLLTHSRTLRADDIICDSTLYHNPQGDTRGGEAFAAVIFCAATSYTKRW